MEKKHKRQKRELPSSAKQSTQIAEDLYVRYGALLSITNIADHFGIGADKARGYIVDLQELGHGTGKRYFYKEVAEAVVTS